MPATANRRSARKREATSRKLLNEHAVDSSPSRPVKRRKVLFKSSPYNSGTHLLMSRSRHGRPPRHHQNLRSTTKSPQTCQTIHHSLKLPTRSSHFWRKRITRSSHHSSTPTMQTKTPMELSVHTQKLLGRHGHIMSKTQASISVAPQMGRLD